MSNSIDISCNILDDEELEKINSFKPRRMELRQWIPELTPKENPFEKGFIKSSYSFPKAFQNKPASDEFPALISRGQVEPSTITTSLLLRVKEKLEKVSTATVSSPVPPVEKSKDEAPKYAICTPDYESHTPPYPPNTPPYAPE